MDLKNKKNDSIYITDGTGSGFYINDPKDSTLFRISPMSFLYGKKTVVIYLGQNNWGLHSTSVDSSIYMTFYASLMERIAYRTINTGNIFAALNRFATAVYSTNTIRNVSTEIPDLGELVITINSPLRNSRNGGKCVQILSVTSIPDVTAIYRGPKILTGNMGYAEFTVFLYGETELDGVTQEVPYGDFLLALPEPAGECIPFETQ